MGDVSRDAILYEAIQRTYRPAIVGYVRRQFNTAYEDKAADQLKRCFGKTWEGMREGAARSRAAGIVAGQPRDEFDLLDVTNFPLVLTNKFDVLFPPRPDESDEARKERKAALVGWSRIVKSIRNPLSHPIEEEMAEGDAVGALTAARKLLLEVDAEAGDRIHDALDQILGRGDRPFVAVLPPAELVCSHFVGRHAELGALAAWLENDGARRHVLAGSGGKGKSALAYEFASRVRSCAPHVDAVVWLSAKLKAFVDGEVEDAPYLDFRTLADAEMRLMRALTGQDVSIDEPVSRRNAVLRALRETRALVVVDDIDTLEGIDEEVHEFFLEASFVTPSKFLFTSRRGIHGLGGATTVIPGLTEEDADALIVSRAQQRSLPLPAFTAERRRRIAAVTDFTPLYIEELIRLISAGVDIDSAVDAWRDRGGEKARRYAISRQLEQLTREARQVLIAAALSAEGAPLPDIAVITAMTEDEVALAVGELANRFLISRGPLAERGVVLLDQNTRSMAAVVAASDYPDDLRKLTGAGRTASGRGPGRGKVREFVARARFLLSAGRANDAEVALAAGLAAFPEHPQLLAELGGLYSKLQPPRVSDARAHFERAHNLGWSDPGMHRRWVRLELSLGQLTKAVATGERSLVRCPSDAALYHLTAHAYRLHAADQTADDLPLSLQDLRRGAELLRVALDIVPASTDRRAFDPAALRAALRVTLEQLVAVEPDRAAVDAIRAQLVDLDRSRGPEPVSDRAYSPRRTTATAATPKSSGAASAGRSDFVGGDRVRHARFGDGTVVSAASRGPGQMLEIDFERVGRKKVLAPSSLLHPEYRIREDK